MRKDTVSVIAKLAPSDSADTFRFTLSTRAVDRMGDTIDPNGWKLTNYRRNPVVLWTHDTRVPAIGRMTSIRVEGDALVGDVEFASGVGHALADTVAALVKSGFLVAGSVGFIPIRWELNSDNGVDFKEQELTEFSIVNVPANAQALIAARSAGETLPDVDRPDILSLDDFRARAIEQSAGPAKAPSLGRHRAAVSKATINLMRIAE